MRRKERWGGQRVGQTWHLHEWSQSITMSSSLNLPGEKVTLLFCCLCVTDGCKDNSASS